MGPYGLLPNGCESTRRSTIARHSAGMTTTHPAPTTAAVPQVPRLRLVRYEPDPEEAGLATRPLTTASIPRVLPPPPPAPPDERVRQHVQQVLRLTLEVLDGRRPIAQLGAFIDPSTLRYLRAVGRRGPGPSRLTSLRMCRPRPDAVEAAAVYRVDGRVRALAARFEQLDGRSGSWQCVAMRLG